jgi:hypothetical protein
MTEETNSKVLIRPDLSKYVKGRSATGKVTHNCGDFVAEQVNGLDVEALVSVVDAVREDIDNAGSRYKTLNQGQQIMNLRNLLRQGLKAGKFTEAQLVKAVAPHAKARDAALKELAAAAAAKAKEKATKAPKAVEPSKAPKKAAKKAA